MKRFVFEGDGVATIEDAPSGVAVRWVDPGESSCLITGFPDEETAYEFVMFADFDEHTFKAEAPYKWKKKLRWEYLP